MPGAYGTRVARPARTRMAPPGGDGSQLGRRVRPVLGDRLPRGQKPGGLTGAGWGDSNSGPPPAVLPVHGHILVFTCSFSQPVVTAGARWAPLAAGRVCTRGVPLASVWPVADASTLWSSAITDRLGRLVRQARGRQGEPPCSISANDTRVNPSRCQAKPCAPRPPAAGAGPATGA